MKLHSISSARALELLKKLEGKTIGLIGFGKTAEQNVELIAKLDQLAREFADFPILIGTSRKSFIGKLLDSAPADERLNGTIASIAASVLNGAHIVRVHDVKPAVEAMRVAEAIRKFS